MELIDKIISFIKRLVKKEDTIKLLVEGKSNENPRTSKDYVKTLKVEINQTKKKKQIETLVCVGDGLGIQNKVTA